MASTIVADDLIVTIMEHVKLGDEIHNRAIVKQITSINEIFKRIVTVTTTLATFLTLSTAAGSGAYIATDLRYLRLTNLDTTNYVTVGLIDTSGDSVYQKLEAGHSLILHNDDIETFTNGSAFSAFSQWDTLNMDADTASCDVEIFAAFA